MRSSIQSDIIKLIDKYSKAALPVKATLWFTACQFLQKGIGLLTTPFIARLLPMAEYGKVSVFATWESIASVIITLSSTHAIFNLRVKHDQKEKILSAIIGYNLLASALWGIILFSTISTVSRITGLTCMLIVLLYVDQIFAQILTCWTQLQQYDFIYTKVVAVTLTYFSLSSFGALFAIAFISQTAIAKILPQVCLHVIIGIAIIINAIKTNRKLYDSDIWHFAFTFCVPLIPHYLSEIILMSSDRIMIDRMCGSADVAMYSVAYTVGSLIIMITSAINSSFAPYQYQKIKSKQYAKLAQNTNYIIAFVAICLCTIMLFNREIVHVFGGDKYNESATIIIPISLGVFFNYVFQLFARVQEYFEQKYTIVIGTISCASLNIILNYYFIALYGYKAAAYTTFFCYFIFCFLHYLFYRLACKKHLGQEIYDIKGLLTISFLLIAASVAIGFISNNLIVKYLFIIISIIAAACQRKRLIEFAKTIWERK